MSWVEYSKLSFSYLRKRGIRSWLTLVGIVIGITAIVSLLLLGNALKGAVGSELEALGGEIIFIGSNPAGQPVGYFGFEDVHLKDVKSIGLFEYVVPMIADNAIIEFKGETKSALFQGLDPESNNLREEELDVELESGRNLMRNDKYTAVIGYNIAYDIFEKDVSVNSKININGKDYKVVGIMEKQGSQSSDNIINAPLKGAQIILGKQGKISGMMAKVREGVDMDYAKNRIQKTLEKRLDDDEFIVITPKEIKEQIDMMIGVVNYVLIGIAVISILVGAIGILNSMYTSVSERTKEIGIFKAIGAKNSDIFSLFVIESGLMGMIGGVLGTTLGILIAKAIGLGVTASGFFTLYIELSPFVILFGILFSFIVGIISGSLPAISAARKNPVDSLRYE